MQQPTSTSEEEELEEEELEEDESEEEEESETEDPRRRRNCRSPDTGQGQTLANQAPLKRQHLDM